MAKIRKMFFRRVRKGHGKQMICKAGCPSLIFDGRGRWIKRDKWKPFSQGKVKRNVAVRPC